MQPNLSEDPRSFNIAVGELIAQTIQNSHPSYFTIVKLPSKYASNNRMDNGANRSKHSATDGQLIVANVKIKQRAANIDFEDGIYPDYSNPSPMMYIDYTIENDKIIIDNGITVFGFVCAMEKFVVEIDEKLTERMTKAIKLVIDSLDLVVRKVTASVSEWSYMLEDPDKLDDYIDIFPDEDVAWENLVDNVLYGAIKNGVSGGTKRTKIVNVR